jgi:AraC-like DNA-binding protein
MQHAPPVTLALGHSTAFLIVSMTFALWSLKANIQHWPGETEPSTAPSPVQRAQEQSVLIRRIQSEMQGGVWQVEGLTVSALALRVKAPEHQVRRAINQELGHRNFASFINAARIDAAKARLSAPDAADQSIQEIAYDVGFASLGPFNRAFRDATGLSPSDYRKLPDGQP